MLTRIYVFLDTDDRIEFLASHFNITKAQAVEIAINDYYRKIQKSLHKEGNVK